MYLFKREGRSNFWWYKFKVKGKVFSKSTRVSNKKEAEQIASAARVNVLRQRAGLPSNKAIPTLAQFIERRFGPYIKERHKAKAKTLRFYQYHAARLLKSNLADVPLDVIGSDQIAKYALRQRSDGGEDGKGLEVSTVNRDLITLRRIFNVAKKDGDLEVEGVMVPPAVRLLPGEKRRDRVLTKDEEEKYLAAAAPLLKDVAVILFDLGLRPDEAYRLKPSQFADGWVTVAGKSADPRRLPCGDRILEVVARRGAGTWLFTAPTKSGHIEESSIKKQHAKALKDSGVEPFVRYDMRHTWNTRIAQDPNVTPAVHQKGAGHKSFETTKRYIHLNDAALESLRPRQ